MKRSAILCASVVAAIALTANCAWAQHDSINYNASKSNTGNRTAPKTGAGNGQPGMAVKNGGVPQNSATATGGGGGAERMGGGGGGRTK
jgi:hypothetical protein